MFHKLFHSLFQKTGAMFHKLFHGLFHKKFQTAAALALVCLLCASCPKLMSEDPKFLVINGLPQLSTITPDVAVILFTSNPHRSLGGDPAAYGYSAVHGTSMDVAFALKTFGSEKAWKVGGEYKVAVGMVTTTDVVDPVFLGSDVAGYIQTPDLIDFLDIVTSIDYIEDVTFVPGE